MKLYIQGVTISEDGVKITEVRYTFRNLSLYKARQKAKRILDRFDDGIVVIVDNNYQEVIGSEYSDSVLPQEEWDI